MFDLYLALAGVALSAFFSGSELAFITANPLQIEVWSKQKRRGAKRAQKLLKDSDGFLISVLVGTTLSNIFATSFATAFLIRAGWQPFMVLLAISVIILLFGEILPKTISGDRPNHFLKTVAPFYRLWQLLSVPVTLPLQKLNHYFNPSRESATNRRQQTTLEREDLKLLLAGRNDSRVLQKSEKELITQVFDLGETPTSKAMTPRTEITAIPETSDLKEVIHAFIESGHSKLPVYRGSLDQIVGVVYLYDVFKDPKDLASIIQPVTMVPDSNTTMSVLRQLQGTHLSIAIVLDEYGGTAGLVTLEDLFEELFGEFEDEFDTQAAESTHLPDGSILMEGKAKIDDLNEQLELGIPDGNYETIAGYLTDSFGRIPFTGERIYLSVGMVVVKKASVRRIEQVQIYPQSAKSTMKQT